MVNMLFDCAKIILIQSYPFAIIVKLLSDLLRRRLFSLMPTNNGKKELMKYEIVTWIKNINLQLYGDILFSRNVSHLYNGEWDSWLHFLCATRVDNQLCRTLNLRMKVESQLKVNALNTHIYPHHLSWEIAALLSRVVQWGVRRIVARGARYIKSIHIFLYSSNNILAHQMCHICFYLLNQRNK